MARPLTAETLADQYLEQTEHYREDPSDSRFTGATVARAKREGVDYEISESSIGPASLKVT
jgi:hypothetical protein